MRVLAHSYLRNKLIVRVVNVVKYWT